MTTTMSPYLRGLEAAGAYAGVSATTMREWIERGMPAHRVGTGPKAVFLIHPRWIDDWLARQAGATDVLTLAR